MKHHLAPNEIHPPEILSDRHHYDCDESILDILYRGMVGEMHRSSNRRHIKP